MAIFAPDERQPNSATLLHGHILVLQAEPSFVEQEAHPTELFL